MIETDRRAFMKSAFFTGAAVAAAGCMSARGNRTAASGAPMHAFRDKPMKGVRVGIIGIGCRGRDGVHRLSGIPGVTITAVCDVKQVRLDMAREFLVKKGKSAPKEFTGSAEAYRALCDWDGVDVVYITAPWQLHVPMGLAALNAGKYAFIEVPSALTVDDCWALVEASERNRRPCMMLENCCYGEPEMLALSLVKQGILGEILHGEGGYNHDLRSWCYNDLDATRPFHDAYWNHWRLRYNAEHDGNQYPTHGFGPICQCMDINRGDKLDYLVSLSSKSYNYERYAKEKYGADHWKGRLKVKMGDVNTTLIKTALGRSIQIRHNVATPQRGYRYESITGSNGIWCGFPDRLYFQGHGAPETEHEDFFDAATYDRMRRKYMHPMWKVAGEIAKKVGGHGGMDFIMDLRWAYCLQAGIPLDFDVYDLASWCSVCELSERSCDAGSVPVEIPDFTRGAWKTNPAPALATIDPKRMGLDIDAFGRNDAQLNI